MNTEQVREATRKLLGDEWASLPEEVQEDAEFFVSDLLETDADIVLEHDGLAGEAADRACPIYYHHQFFLLSDDRTREWMEANAGNVLADGYIDMQALMDVSQGSPYLFACGAAAAQYVQALSGLFDRMLQRLLTPAGLAAFGLDADAAEIATRLLPEWSGTVEGLLVAASRLAAEAVTA